MPDRPIALLLAATVLVGIATMKVTHAAEGNSAAALTGTVSSQADGPMEGVLVGAKKAGSTIAISVDPPHPWFLLPATVSELEPAC